MLAINNIYAIIKPVEVNTNNVNTKLTSPYKIFMEEKNKKRRAPRKSSNFLLFRVKVPIGTSKVRTFEKQSFSSAHFLEVPRNIYIDIMKGLLITLVVIGHLPYFEYDSRTLILIYSFHMHAFLIIGGILSHVNENTKISTILYKRIKGTLIPYFVFYLITFIIVPTTTEQKLNAIPVVIKGIGIPPDHALNLPLWFLTFYFVVMTLFEIIQIIAHRIAKLFVGALRRKFATRMDETCKLTTCKGENCELALTIIFTLIFIAIIMRISFIYARIYKLNRLPYNAEIAGFCLSFVFFGNVLGKIIPKIYKYWQHIKINNKIIGADTIQPHISKTCKPSSTKNANSNSTRTYNNKSIILKAAIIIISIFALILIAKTWYEYSMWNGRIDLNARDYKNAFYMYIDAILGFILFAVFAYIIFIVSEFANQQFTYFQNYQTNKETRSILQKIICSFYYLLESPAKLFSYLGKNSIYILAFHVPSVFYTNTFVMPFIPQLIRETLSHNSIISIIIMSFFGIAFSLLCALFHKAIRLRISKLHSAQSINFKS